MARSRLYRSRFLQENIRWKALDEIYKIYTLLHRSDLNISAYFRREFLRFFMIFHDFSNNIVKIVQRSCRFVLKLHCQSITKKMWGRKEKKTSPDFVGISQIFQKFDSNFFHNPHTENLKKILGFLILRTKTI